MRVSDCNLADIVRVQMTFKAFTTGLHGGVFAVL